MPSACDPGTLGCKYSASDSNSGPHDGSSHCSQQCSVQSVSDGKIRSCGSCFRRIGYHGKNHRFRRSEACKTLFQKTSETFCSHGNYLWCAAFLYPYSGLKPLPAFSGNQRNGEYISYYLKRGDVGNVLSDAYQWRHYSGKWQYCLFHEGGSN